MKKKKTQLLGIVLSAAMLATSVPAPVYAEPTDNVAEEEDSDAAAVQETTDEADAVVTLQDGEYISNDLPSCTVVSPVRQIEAVSAIDLDTGDRVWKIKMLDTQEIGYLVRKGA